MSVPLCIYHGGCPDGFTAAWVVRGAMEGLLTDGCDFHPGVYGQDPPDCTGRSVYTVDFTYPREVMMDIAETAAQLTVLDHHQTAIENCASIKIVANVTLDMNRSGARLAWDHFYGPEDPPDIVRFVEDRDLWRFAYPETKDYHAALTSRPYTFEAWDEIAGMRLDTILTEGVAISRYRDQLIAQAVANADYGEVAGVVMPVANCLYAIGSDVAGALADRSMERVAAYYLDDHKNGVRQWGLRSTPDGPDVAAMAETMGGGGHKHAAGFKTPIP
jgi:nanoRNase/pAp phosphatase (c-di-AMP/oligoRNAs hydrolase)